MIFGISRIVILIRGEYKGTKFSVIIRIQLNKLRIESSWQIIKKVRIIVRNYFVFFRVKGLKICNKEGLLLRLYLETRENESRAWRI